MINLIVISATVLILVAVLLVVSVKSLVKTESGEVLVVKSIFNSSYKIKPEGGRLLPIIYSGRKVKVISGSNIVSTDVNCLGGTGYLREVEVSYSFSSRGLSSHEMITVSDMGAQLVISSINNIVISSIHSIVSGITLKELADDINSVIRNISELIILKVKENLLIQLESLNIDFVKNNYRLINSVYEDSPKPEVEIDVIEQAEKNSEKQIRLAEIELSKSRRMNEIEIDKAKEQNEKEIQLRDLELQKYSRMNNSKTSHDLASKKSEIEKSYKMSQMTLENDNKIKELQNSNRLSEIEDEKASKLAEINSKLEVKLKEEEVNQSINDKEKESEIKKINNNLEIKKAEYNSNKSLHPEMRDEAARKLDLEVILPAEKDAEKNKLLAESASEVKKIETESSIEVSKIKTEYKKDESKILSEIKKEKDELDMSVYKNMLSIAGGNEELAIKWKSLETSIEITKIQSAALSKLPLDKIVINGSNGDNILSSIINALSVGPANIESNKSKK